MRIIKTKRKIKSGGVFYLGDRYEHPRLKNLENSWVLIQDFGGEIEVWMFELEVRQKWKAPTVITHPTRWVCTLEVKNREKENQFVKDDLI